MDLLSRMSLHPSKPCLAQVSFFVFVFCLFFNILFYYFFNYIFMQNSFFLRASVGRELAQDQCLGQVMRPTEVWMKKTLGALQ